ncbi:MAG TPA: ABC transporter permease [Bryobacteraceae bacterium]|nr:ABC transporter permease [Bryobacteraceae bacterium]
MYADLSYCLRNWLRHPVPAVAALLTLALGIGVNTAVFSVVNAVLLRPLPYRDASRLVTIRAQIPHLNIYGAFVEYHAFGEWWRARSHSFETLSAYSPGSANLILGDEPERVATCRVNAGFLAMTGVSPALGRDFLPDEDRPGAERVAILTDELWRRRFGADRTAVGRQIVLDYQNYTVVGVLPPGFELYGSDVGVFVPLASSTARVPGMPSVGVFGRLKPGLPLALAQTEIDELCRQWVAQFHYPADWGARVWTVHDFAIRDVRASVMLVWAGAGLVLCIACVNVANLLLARAAGRQREIAIRSALGASIARIVRQLLVESAMLGAIAAALGLAAAWIAVRAFAAAPLYLPFQKSVSIDAPVLLFTLFVALGTTALFSLAPALSLARTELSQNLKEGTRGGGEGVGRRRFRSALVVAEVALSTLLVIGATLTARSFTRLQAVDPGFRAEGVLTASLTLPSTTYGDPVKRVSLIQAVSDRLQSIPTVTAAGMVSHLPFSNAKSGAGILVEGAAPPRPGEKIIVFQRSATRGYFEAVGARLVRGRIFDLHDVAGRPVAVINETMARRGWPNQDAVGSRFGDGSPEHWIAVVGGDLRHTADLTGGRTGRGVIRALPPLTRCKHVSGRKDRRESAGTFFGTPPGGPRVR